LILSRQPLLAAAPGAYPFHDTPTQAQDRGYSTTSRADSAALHTRHSRRHVPFHRRSPSRTAWPWRCVSQVPGWPPTISRFVCAQARLEHIGENTPITPTSVRSRITIGVPLLAQSVRHQRILPCDAPSTKPYEEATRRRIFRHQGAV